MNSKKEYLWEYKDEIYKFSPTPMKDSFQQYVRRDGKWKFLTHYHIGAMMDCLRRGTAYGELEGMGNQCDGCRRGLPVDEFDIHREKDGYPYMVCESYRYIDGIKGKD